MCPIKTSKIILISSSMSKANIRPFLNFVDILREITDNLFIIATCADDCDFDNYKFPSNEVIVYKKYGYLTAVTLMRTHLINQFKMSYSLIRNIKNADLCIFYLGDVLIFPFLISKLFRKKTMLVLGGYLEKEIEINGYPKFILYFKKLNLFLTDHIVLYSARLIGYWDLQKYNSKIKIAHKHFLNFELFNVYNRFEDRENIIAYIGRFSQEKGVMNFVQSLPLLFQNNEDVKVVLVGDGPLKNDLQQYISNNNLNSKVEISDWVQHNELPHLLNKIKFVVLPSYTEGLSNLILEAMACGTIVIATPVGATPDVVVDGKTGFILENNEPEEIATTISRTFNCMDLKRISNESQLQVQANFTLGCAKEKYLHIISNI